MAGTTEGTGISGAELLQFGTLILETFPDNHLRMREIVHNLSIASNPTLDFPSSLQTLQKSTPHSYSLPEILKTLNSFIETQSREAETGKSAFGKGRTFSIAWVSLGGFFVLLRLFAKFHLGKESTYRRRLQKDDWAIFVAWLSSISYLFASQIAILVNHFKPSSSPPGKTSSIICSHIWDVTKSELQDRLQWLYFSELFFLTMLWLVKAAVMLFYWKIVPRRLGAQFSFFHKSIVAVFGLHVIIMLVAFSTVAFQCLPVRSFWEAPATAKCLPREDLWVALNTACIVVDVLLLILPIRVVWKLDLSLREKFIVTGLFGLGGLAILAAIPRAVATSQMLQDKDITFKCCSIPIWIQLEANLALMAICIPATKGLVMRYAPRLLFDRKCNSSKGSEREDIPNKEDRSRECSSEELVSTRVPSIE